MSLRHIPLRSVTADDLRALKANGVGEQHDLEYKETWPSGRDEDNYRTLAAITSVANTAGGDLIIGITAPKGIPVDIPGLEVGEIDEGMRRLNQLLETRVDPPIIGLEMRPVEIAPGRACLVIRVPTSLLRPHGVKVNGFWRFWGRNSAGKYPLNVDELRVAFSTTESLSERIQRFRAERLSLIQAGQTPARLKAPSALVVHFVPFSAMSSQPYVDVALVQRRALAIVPLYPGGMHTRYNLEGYASWLADAESRSSTVAYAQVFRSGAIEAVVSDVLMTDQEEPGGGQSFFLPLDYYEPRLLEMATQYLHILEVLGCSAPIFVLVSLLGVEGAYGRSAAKRSFHATSFDRDVVMVPMGSFENYETSPEVTMHPVFDTLWNAVGDEASPNFRPDGRYHRR